MDDLSHYDLFSVFTLQEAAYLAAGVEPRSFERNARGETILEAMRHGLRGTMCWLDRSLVADENCGFPPWALLPTEVRDKLNTDGQQFADKEAFAEWIKARRTQYKNESKVGIDRAELGRWFKAKGLGYQPRYPFTPGPSESLVVAPPDQPLLTRERNTYLTIIAVIAKMASLDLDQPSKAAEQVTNAAASQGITLALRTVAEKLKLVPDALEARSK